MMTRGERILVLKPAAPAEQTGEWRYAEYRRCNADVELTDKKNLFSQNGLGARQVEIILRHDARMTLHDRIVWRGLRLFLTAILPLDARYDRVLCAIVEEKTCVYRPNAASASGPTFPGVLTEKYVRHEQPAEPYAANVVCYVLVTPKGVEMQPGALVSVEGEPYAIRVRHVLDAFKEEYEIERMADL